MRKCKLIAGLLAVSMTAGSIGILPVMAEDDPIVYTYTNEAGATVNITQSELDAEHWDKDLLGENAPLIYQSFPMKMTGFTNDFAETSLDLIYMKRLTEFDSVHLKICDFDNLNVVYDSDLEMQSFYSPILTVGHQYDVVLTETIDGVSTDYEKIVTVNETEAKMPDYVTGISIPDDAPIILIKDIDTLKRGHTVNSGGNIIIDSTVANYDKISANNFAEYCNSLDTNKIYRVYTYQGGEQYDGFLKFSNENVQIFDVTINAYDLEDLYNPVPMSNPGNLTYSDVAANAQHIRLSDASFHLRENNSYTKWASFQMSVPDDYAEEIRTGNFEIVISADTQITAKIWCDTGSSNMSSRTLTSNNNTNTIRYNIVTSNYSPCSYMDFVVLVYFPASVEGYGMISFEPTNTDASYGDDVTGSISAAYNGDENSCFYEMSNREFTMTDSWDVDAFAFDYWGTNNIVYKIDIKNRSVAEQANLQNGILGNGSPEKQLTLWYIDSGTTSLEWQESKIYTIPKNTDVTIYVNPLTYEERVFTVNNKATGLTTSNKYQLAFAPVN